MLLKRLHDLAYTKQLLEDPAFSHKAVNWLIEIDAEGHLVGPGPLSLADDKRRGKPFSVPTTRRGKGGGQVAEFLHGDLRALFGIHSDRNAAADTLKNVAEKQADFWKQIQNAAEATGRAEFQALTRFHEQTQQTPTFLRCDESDGKAPVWWVRTAGGDEVKFKPEQSFTFRVAGNLLVNDAAIRAYWRGQYAAEMSDKTENANLGVCLITGQSNQPLARTHDIKIQGIPKAQPSGASLVSFDKKSFCSYGFKDSLNAGCSIDAATAYTKALNFLLSDQNHHLKLGDAVTCFWAAKTPQAAGFLHRKLTEPDPKGVKAFLKSPWSGLDDGFARADQFYGVTLSATGGRVVVRHWRELPFETVVDNLAAWFRDLEIAHHPQRSSSKSSDEQSADAGPQSPPFALYSLAKALVRDPKKDLPTDALTVLYRAAVERTAPPLSYLDLLLRRLRADLPKDSDKPLGQKSRFSLIRLILNRHAPETLVIDPTLCDTADPAYNCGRLLAVFDDLQAKAHDHKLGGATVVARYYGTASSFPNSAFGILWRLHQHHLNTLKRQGDKGQRDALFISRKIGDIAAQFSAPGPRQPPQFPISFNLQEQGRFALGFYQQKAHDEAQKQAAKERKQAQTATVDATTPAEDDDFGDELPQIS